LTHSILRKCFSFTRWTWTARENGTWPLIARW